MKILGISANNYHDASACLVIDGKVIANSSEDRFTMQKHDPNFPLNSIRFCLEQAHITTADLDLVSFHEVPEVKLTRSLSASFLNFPHSLKMFNQSMREAINSSFWFRQRTSLELDIDPTKITFTPHHLSHAAHSFLTSPFEKAAVLTVDGVGEWMSGGIFWGDRNAREPLKPLHLIPFPHSLGIAYAAFTGYLGFKVNDSECSTMALAAFGKPTYYDEVRKIVKPHTDGTYELDLSYFNFVNPHELPLTAKFIKIFGPARSHKEKINFDCFMDAKLQKVSVEEQRYADIACSIQQVVEEELIKLAQKSQVLTGSENLCFSGGVAMNCVANSKLAASAVFKNIFVPIDPGDGGGAIGSALYTSFLKEPEKQKIPEVASPYLGTALHTEAAIKTLSGFKKDKFKITAFEDDNSLAQYCADLLFDKKIMGWAQGRAENGPRALGHRSILIRPDDIDLAKKLSQSVKKRAYFRPYACSLATEAAEVLFENTLIDSQNKLRQLKWMQTAAAVKPEAQSKIRSTIHIDGTTRPQICSIEDDRSYYQLLTAFGERSGLAALLNTSFNLSGFPLVNSSHEALLMFMSTAMDVLVLDRHVIEK